MFFIKGTPCGRYVQNVYKLRGERSKITKLRVFLFFFYKCSVVRKWNCNECILSRQSSVKALLLQILPSIILLRSFKALCILKSANECPLLI